MEHTIKNGILIIFFSILLLPFLQQNLPFISSGRLYGYTPEAPNVAFSFEKWWDGSYTQEKNKYLNDNVGFRPDMVRLNNQVNYSLCHAIHTGRIVEGMDHYLYINNYTDGYYGRDFIGYDSIRHTMVKLKAIQDTLQRMGKTLILAYSPSKEFVYPEYIPLYLRSKVRTITNFDAMVHTGDSLGINQVNFNSWFMGMKNKTTEAIYARQGIHWTIYGSYLAADSLARAIERLRHIHMPHPVWTKMEHSNIPKYGDNDIALTLNLIYPIVSETFTYPEVTYPQDKSMVKPNVIYIGDSFLIAWDAQWVLDNLNNNWQIWYYMKGFMNKDNRLNGSTMADFDWVSAIKNTDCVVIMYTTGNLPELGDGFIERAYNYYYPGCAM